MLLRFLPLLLLLLCAGCLTGASGEGNASQSSSRSQFETTDQSSSALVIIATVTPVPQQPTTRLVALASPTLAAATPATATDTATPAPTDTQVPAPPTNTSTTTPMGTSTSVLTNALTAIESATKTATGAQISTPTPSPTRSPTVVVGSSSFRLQLLAGHNQVRRQAGLSNLSLNATLNQIAQQRAETMASLDRMTHYNTNGTTAFDMMNALGYSYSDAAENIAYNYGYSPSRSLSMVMQQWINSPMHYKNIVNGNLTRIGFGMATSASGVVYYSAVFSD